MGILISCFETVASEEAAGGACCDAALHIRSVGKPIARLETERANSRQECMGWLRKG